MADNTLPWTEIWTDAMHKRGLINCQRRLTEKDWLDILSQIKEDSGDYIGVAKFWASDHYYNRASDETKKWFRRFVKLNS
jgi:hypothetical protein